MNASPSFHPDTFVARLRLEYLDERIAPSASRIEAYLHRIDHAIAEFRAWVNDHVRWEDSEFAHSGHGRRWTNHDNDNHNSESDANDRDPIVSKPTPPKAPLPAASAVPVKSTGVAAAHVVAAETAKSSAAASDDRDNNGPDAAAGVWLDAADVADHPAVTVPGTAAVQLSDKRLNIVFPDGKPAAPVAAPVIVATELSDELPVAPTPAGDAAPENLTVPPTLLAQVGSVLISPPVVHATEFAARFVPFDPAALDSSVQRFLDSLKAPAAEKSGFSFTRASIFCATFLGVGLIGGEFVRRKKLPLKAASFLTLTRLLTRSKTA